MCENKEFKLSPKTLFLMKVCFYCNVILLVLFLSLPVTITLIERFFPAVEVFGILGYIQILAFPSFILLVYNLYFYYKYDKYSSAGFKLFFFNIFFSPLYFYKVVWKRKRRLIASYQSEPVLGNTIHIETILDDEE